MNDMANQFYNTWVAVKGAKGPAKLLWTWHVDKAWKEELGKKVGDASAEAEIYKIICTCLKQTSENRYQDCLHGLLNSLETNPKAQSFWTYLFREWVSKKTSWTYANMFSEAFHWVFKRIYLGSQISKRLDCCLVNMVKLSFDKAFDRAIKLTKKKAHLLFVKLCGKTSLESPDSLFICRKSNGR